MDNKVTSGSIGSGDMLNLIDDAIGKVSDDIFYRNEVKTKRTVTVKIELIPKESHVSVVYGVETKMPKDNTSAVLAFIDANGVLVKEIKKQQSLPNISVIGKTATK